MPIYEYRCQSCHKKSSFFVKSISTSLVAVCAHCQSKDMERVISSFAYHKSAQSLREESAGAPPFGAGMDYYKDPSNIGRHVEETFEQSGMEIPDSIRETIEAAREGEMPEGLDL